MNLLIVCTFELKKKKYIANVQAGYMSKKFMLCSKIKRKC